jgi:hypothetical protein
MADRFLYVSNYDPSQLLDYVREAIGADLDVANTRHEAETALDKNEYKGVIMTDLALTPGVLEDGETWTRDLREGHKNGIRVARKVKQKGLPLIVLTTFADEFRGELIEIGAVIFKKSIGYEQFIEALKKLR